MKIRCLIFKLYSYDWGGMGLLLNKIIIIKYQKKDWQVKIRMENKNQNELYCENQDWN